MRTRGPNVLITCSACGLCTEVRTTIKRAMIPGNTEPRHHILVPMLFHQADGGHMALHPAMLMESLGDDDSA